MGETGKCENCGRGCGKNKSENRILADIEGKSVSNRDIVCRDCTYKKKGDTKSCYIYEAKPEDILLGGKCEKYLKGDIMGKNESSCKGCKGCG